MTIKEIALIKSLFAVDAKGKFYLRVIENAPKKLENALSSQSAITVEGLLSKVIALDEDGNPALCIANVKFGSTIEDADKKRRKKMVEAEKLRKKKQLDSYAPPKEDDANNA